jgi:hypothetical protein
MKRAVESKALHGLNGCSIGLKRRHQAAIHQLAVHAHGARATLAFAASFLGAGQVQIFAQHIEQSLHGQYTHRAIFTIEVKPDCASAIAHEETVSIEL